MTSSEWEEVKQIVADALEVTPAGRDAFVAQACPHAELRQEVASLLAAYAAADAEDLLSDQPGPGFQDGLQEGTRIGAYQVVRLLGRGGMGAVYLADRADGAYEQQVALKLIDRSVPGRELVRRFLTERSILARLQHPRIARLLDGGMMTGLTGEVPFLAMEYVDGEPITTYCAQRDASLDQRLDLFLQVCEAVGYAHRNLVVHRDLKPGNVLVVEREGVPQVKLLDFGIAKLIAETDDEPLTQTGLRVLTPECAAPEQLRGGTVTTATDVYALGVLLYELTTGRKPYALQGRSAAEIERVVCETEPERPSGTLRFSSEAQSTGVQRGLRGDLDQIILKALRKEPDRRYASADALADDIRRHQQGLPVRARPDTLGYRAAKFTRRHRLGVGMAAVMALLLVAGLFVTAGQARRAAAEAEKAASVNRFLLGMLAAADPEREGRSVTVAELLDAAVVEADRGLHAQRDVEAAVRHTIGNTYVALGLYDEGERELRRALTLREQLYGPRHLDVAETQGRLAYVMQRQGAFDVADSLYRLTLATVRAAHGEEHEAFAAAVSDLGVNLWEKGDYAAAEAPLRQALALEEKLLGPEHVEVAISLGNLATLLADLGNEAEAEPMYARQLQLLKRIHGDEHPNIALALSHLGVIRHDLGHVAEADSLHTLALAMYRKLKGDRHPDVAFALNNLATTKVDLGALDEAEALQLEAIATLQAVVGETHPNVGIQFNNLGSTRSTRGDLAGAEAAYSRAVEVWRGSLSPDHPYLAFGLHNVGAIRLKQGRAAEAEAPLREALAIREALLPPDHETLLITQSFLGACLGRLGRRAEAERLLVSSYEALRAKFGPEHARVEEAAERLAMFYSATGRADAAARIYPASTR